MRPFKSYLSSTLPILLIFLLFLSRSLQSLRCNRIDQDRYYDSGQKVMGAMIIKSVIIVSVRMILMMTIISLIIVIMVMMMMMIITMVLMIMLIMIIMMIIVVIMVMILMIMVMIITILMIMILMVMILMIMILMIVILMVMMDIVNLYFSGAVDADGRIEPGDLLLAVNIHPFPSFSLCCVIFEMGVVVIFFCSNCKEVNQSP